MSQEIEQSISNLIQSQFPAFYNDEGPTLVAFIQAYYEWLEETGNPVYQARNLFRYSDIDKTLEEFVVYFSNTYLKGIQYDSLADKRLTVKRVLDLYRAKGNIRALKLLFQLVFKEDIDVYFPEVDILKPSDNTWTVPYYLEVSSSPRNLEYVGKTVYGVTSGASAFVDRIIRRKVESRYIDIFFITNISNNIDFQTGEQLDVDGNLTNVPLVIGSLSELIVDEGGYGFKIGQIVNLESLYGIEGTAVVTSLEDVSGIVTFKLLDGGWGFTNNYSNVLISETVLYLGNIKTSEPAYGRPIPKFANVTINITANSTANLYGNAFAYGSSVNIVSIPVTGTFKVNEKIKSSDTYANGIVTSIFTNNYSLLTLSSPTGSFSYRETVYQANSTTANVAVGTVYALNSTALIVAPANGVFVTSSPSANYKVTGVLSGATSNVISTTIPITSLSVSNVYNSYFASGQTITGEISGATANVFHFDSEVGVFGLGGVVNTSFDKVYFSSGNASLIGFSSGTNANVAIGAINTTETIFYYKDKVNDYLSLPLNSTVYGFPKYPYANLTTGYLIDILDLEILQAGEIENIIVKNPGNQYTYAPYVEFYQDGVATQNKQDYVITVDAYTGAFIENEEVTQDVTQVSLIELDLATDATFTPGEIIYQVNSTPAGTFVVNSSSTLLVSNSSVVDYTTTFAAGNKLVVGEKELLVVNNVIDATSLYFRTAPLTSNDATSISVASSTGIVLSVPQANIVYFSNTGNSSVDANWYTTKQVYGLISSSSPVVDVITPGAPSVALGKVLASNSTTLSVRRWSVGTEFTNSGSAGQITGTLSGTSATVNYVVANTISAYAGDNANVFTRVISANGSVKSLEITSSGIGYINSESVVFSSNDGLNLGVARTVLAKQGKGTGYYSSTKGFLSDDKYIQDGNYYQIFSYEVRSTFGLDKYQQMVKDVVHVAGTKLFGAVVKKSTIDTPLNITSSNTGPIIG